MKHIFLPAVYILLSSSVYAQPVNSANPDSVAYQNQRKKINSMLAQRAVKFGQYDASLSKHTGIFGLQTKKDIRRSNDILMDIVQTDNGIFTETKVLLAFKTNQLNYQTYQQQTVQSHAKETEDMALGFMNTINKLRKQTEQLKAETAEAEKKASNLKGVIGILVVLIAASILFILVRLRAIKP